MRTKALFLSCAILAACSSPPPPIAPGALSNGDPFVPVGRETKADEVAARQSVLAKADAPDLSKAASTGDDFYLAINKTELGKRWFISAYLKQYLPGAVSAGAARSLGTRVVSFAVQNGKLFVFDVDNRHKDSDTFDPQVIVEAYPIVTGYAPFESSPNSSDYVLFDPAGGLNRFGALSDAFARGSDPAHFAVELSFLQRFRKIDDGVTYEQVFTGYADLPLDSDTSIVNNTFRASGTLGVALRRYSEGDGFTPIELPKQELYFRSQPRILTNTGEVKQVPIKWNIHPGMTPIRWVISDHLLQLKNDPKFKDYDIVGALQRGIENWNQVFGFKVLEATVASPDDSYADDDTNYLLFDEDPTFGAAFANWRTNPNTGEIRGASIYFNSIWLSEIDALQDDPTPTDGGTASDGGTPTGDDGGTPTGDDGGTPTGADGGSTDGGAGRTKKHSPALVWQSMPDTFLCQLPASSGRLKSLTAGDSNLPPMTKGEKFEAYLTHTIVHEVGHTLGLRHNFKGSSEPPSSSVMDYLQDDDAIAMANPGAYDTQAIRFLYNLSTDEPTSAFCTDEDTETDPTCARFDAGRDPLTEFHGPVYARVIGRYLDGKLTRYPEDAVLSAIDYYMNNVLSFVRAGATPEVRLAAFNLAFDPIRAADPDKLKSIDGYGDRFDVMRARLAARLYTDGPDLLGDFTQAAPTDAEYMTQVLAFLHANLVNTDGALSYGTRRAAIDVLKKMQQLSAYQLLQSTRSELRDQLADATLADDQAQLKDLIARIDAATSPYFK